MRSWSTEDAIVDTIEDLELDEAQTASLRSAVETLFVAWLFGELEKEVRAGEISTALAMDAWLQHRFSVYPAPDRIVRSLSERGLALLENERMTEAGWPDVTVNDRIDAAFGELNAAGIVALQNAGITMTTGWEDARGRRKPDSRGAVFFHAQDLERGLQDEGLHLVFGAFDSDDDIAIGREVVAVLERHGVKTSWTESAEERICIEPFEWRKRRFPSQ